MTNRVKKIYMVDEAYVNYMEGNPITDEQLDHLIKQTKIARDALDTFWPMSATMTERLNRDLYTLEGYRKHRDRNKEEKKELDAELEAINKLEKEYNKLGNFYYLTKKGELVATCSRNIGMDSSISVVPVMDFADPDFDVDENYFLFRIPISDERYDDSIKAIKEELTEIDPKEGGRRIAFLRGMFK